MVVVTSDSILKSNLLTQAYWNVYNLVNTRSNVADPNPDGASGKRKFVYSREPKTSALSFKGYPFVIIHPAKTNFSRRNLARTFAQVDWEMIVEVRSADTFRSEDVATDPQGAGLSWLDGISDDVLEAFNSRTNKNTLETYGMYFVSPEVGSVDTIETENEVVYVREIRLGFRNALLTVN